MGARLVGAALNPHWAHLLNPTERLVLITMCHTAKDVGTEEHPARLYFAGHDSLIITLTGDEQTPGTAGFEAARKQVQRAIKGLVQAGAVTPIGTATRGRNARYVVTPDNYAGPTKPVENLAPVHQLRLPGADTDVPRNGTQMSRYRARKGDI